MVENLFRAGYLRRRSAKYFVGFILIAVLSAGVARAEDPDEAYVDVYNLVQQADALKGSGKSSEALARYQQAQIALKRFQKNHPEWKPKVIAFRANYLVEQIAELSRATPSGQQTAGGQTNQPSAQSAGSAPAGVVFKLLQPGAEPRKALRLHPKQGDKQTSTMTVKSTMAMKVGEMKQPPMKLPAIVLTLETTVKSVSGEGDITYETIATDSKAEGEADALPLGDAVGKLKGMSGSGTISSRGFKKAGGVKLPGGGDAQSQQLMEQMKDSFARLSVPLPEEPVGIGAKWQVRTPVKSGGIAMDVDASYELASIDGEKLTLKTTFKERAGNQKVENPAMPGIKLDLTRLTGSSQGEMALELAQILPQQMTMDGGQEAVMAMASGAQKQEMTVSITVNLTLESK